MKCCIIITFFVIALSYHSVNATVITYTMPSEAIANGLSSSLFTVKVNGKSIPVYRGPNTAINNCFAYFDFGNDTVTVEVIRQSADWPATAVIRPKSKNIAFVRNGKSLTFSLSQPADISVETTGNPYDDLLMLFANPLVPDSIKNGKHKYKYGPGYYKELKKLELNPDESVYIDGGAVIEGLQIYQGKIYGRGIIVNDLRPNKGTPDWKANFVTGNVINGIIQLKTDEYGFWGCQPSGGVIDNFHIVSDGNTDDGIDPQYAVGLTIKNCFIRTKDDCIAIKSVPWFEWGIGKPSRDITIENNVFFSREWGNAVTIGVETSGETSNITIRNNDIIHTGEVWARGGLTILTCGEGRIHNILFENNRLEDCLVGIAVIYELSYHDRQGITINHMGQIDNITFRNISIDKEKNWVYLMGCTYKSMTYKIGPITFENCTRGGEPICNAHDLKMLLYDENVQNISITNNGNTMLYNPGVNCMLINADMPGYVSNAPKITVNPDVDIKLVAETNIGQYIEWNVGISESGTYCIFAETGGGWQRWYAGKVKLFVNDFQVGGLWDLPREDKKDFGTVTLNNGQSKFRFVSSDTSGEKNGAWILLNWFQIAMTKPAETTARSYHNSVSSGNNQMGIYGDAVFDIMGRPIRGTAPGLRIFVPLNGKRSSARRIYYSLHVMKTVM